MSGSPKYNSVALAEARRAQAEAERVERARRREQERQRRLAAAVGRAKATAGRRCASLASRYAALRETATEAGFVGAVGEQAATATRLAAEIAAAADHPAVAAANRQLDTLERQIEALSEAVSQRQEAAASARLARLTASLEEIPRAERLLLDSSGGQAAETALGTAQATEHASGPNAAALGPDAQMTASVDDAAQRVAEHLERVRIAQAERAALLREAEFQIEDLHSRLEVLEVEGRDFRIEVEGARHAHDYLNRLRRWAAEGRTGELTPLLPQVAAAIARTESQFDAAVGRVVERRRILTSIVASLPDMGFGVVADSLTERPDGSVSVRAQTALGQTLDVLVQDGGQGADEVLYSSSDLAGEEMAGGITGGTCGTLLEVIGALNEKAQRDGYLTGAVTWDDGPDPDPDHTAARRPPAVPQVRKVGG